jgi:hypothetical protein
MSPVGHWVGCAVMLIGILAALIYIVTTLMAILDQT